MTLRDGLYTTNKNIKFQVQGLYFWKTGELIFIANPSVEEKMFMPPNIREEEDEEMDLTTKKAKKNNFLLENINFKFNNSFPVTPHLVLSRFASFRNVTSKSELFSDKCYYEVYIKMSHFGKN